MDRQNRTAATPLAKRLRELRDGLTQKQVGDAFGASVPLISSWESGLAVPPDNRLAQYATLFARKHADDSPIRMLTIADLTDDEKVEQGKLLDELVDLRTRRLSVRQPLSVPQDTIGGGTWYFADRQPITIICSQMPASELGGITHHHLDALDFVSSYRLGDLDALIELHGHIRAVNPTSQVTIRSAGEVTADDMTTHIVLLGGVDYNRTAADILRLADFPIHQAERSDKDDRFGYFTLDKDEKDKDDKDAHRFRPEVIKTGTGRRLLSDVALFYRGVNPNNAKRTVTMCNGLYSRGTYGAVRALTDSRFRDRNEQFIASRFQTHSAYCILSKVSVINHRTMTPNFSDAAQRVYEWSDQPIKELAPGP